jgi:hypothetical protein
LWVVNEDDAGCEDDAVDDELVVGDELVAVEFRAVEREGWVEG